jgi:hypothetical protein
LKVHADEDGIVCLAAIKGETQAEQRLNSLLADAFRAEWSAAKLAGLLAEAGYAGKSIDDWLRDGFFAQHCELFQQRPFVWHIWDGRRDGFHALVNYHRLAAPNDGVRMNIRPFLAARTLNARGANACILRVTPKIKWDKDRGKEPTRDKADYPWFWGWDEASADFAGGGDVRRQPLERSPLQPRCEAGRARSPPSEVGSEALTDAAPKTLVDAIDASLGQALRSPDGVAPPAALLWTDADGQWAPLASTVQSRPLRWCQTAPRY